MVAVLFLILWPVAELFVAIQVAHAIGVLLTVVLLLAGWPIGMWLAKTEGRAAWRRLTAAVNAGRPPGREVIDGALGLVGAVMLMIPGFITDVLGVLLLLAPSRSLARAVITRNFQSRLVVSRMGGIRFPRTPRSAYDVDSTATDLDNPQLHG